MTVVLDASALLALLWSEPGSEVVADVLPGALLSAVNLAEVCSKLVDRGVDGQAVRDLLLDLPIRIAGFDERQALIAGEFRRATRSLGLSIGDRACLALAHVENATAMTADRSWSGLGALAAVRLIR